MNQFLTNGTEIKQRIISEIQKAQRCIFIAMAYFTDRDIAMALIEAKNRGIHIDVILSSNAQNETVKLMLIGGSISVHAFETGDPRGIMHHKFCLIDERISINGSYNYSINASTNNVENITVSDNVESYEQMNAEFERLKYNIDNRIAVNETVEQKTEINDITSTASIYDSFNQRLHNLIYSAADIDMEIYRNKGYANSKESVGNLDIFRTEYYNIKEKIKTFATDEGLGSKKNILTSNISLAFEEAKSSYDNEKNLELEEQKRAFQFEEKQHKEKIDNLKSKKTILERGNEDSGEQGLIQINKAIAKNKLDSRSIEESFFVSKFWTPSTVLLSTLLGIFSFYLSIFFASAIYKVFFEQNEIRSKLEAQINPGIPQLIDANAIINIFQSQGTLFGLLATLFFIIPILLSNLKLLGSKNKWVNGILFWVGLLIFDILVSTMVTINTEEIKALLEGREPDIGLIEVIKHPEFYLIFVFGMFPLILMHYLIENVSSSYKKSRRDLVDAEKYRKIQLLTEEMIDLDSSKTQLTDQIVQIEAEIDNLSSLLYNLENALNKETSRISSKYSELQKSIKTIFDDYRARITSGKIFTEVIFDSVSSAYKSGFIEFLPEYYADDEVTKRVKEIEKWTESANL